MPGKRFAVLALVAALAAGSVPSALAVASGSPAGPPETVEERWPDGSPRLRKQVARLDDGTVVDHGRYERWYADGGKEYEATFVLGRKSGTAVRYHRNGRIASRQEYRDGVRHGTSTWWDETGRKVKEERWADGRPHGTWTVWRDDGDIEWTHTYERGDPAP